MPLPPWLSAGNVAETLKFVGDFAIVFFALVQWKLAKRVESDKQRAAYMALYAESWRVRALHLEWEKADLSVMQNQGFIDPDDLVLRDWAELARMMGEVGPETAALGGYAYSRMYQARMCARALSRGTLSPQMRAETEVKCKKHLSEAADLLTEALNQGPYPRSGVHLNFREAVTEPGGRLIAAIPKVVAGKREIPLL